jgi:hypothetical protein
MLASAADPPGPGRLRVVGEGEVETTQAAAKSLLDLLFTLVVKALVAAAGRCTRRPALQSGIGFWVIAGWQLGERASLLSAGETRHRLQSRVPLSPCSRPECGLALAAAVGPSERDESWFSHEVKFRRNSRLENSLNEM